MNNTNEENLKSDDLNSDKKEQLNKVEKRIKDLEEHRHMWFKAGGMGGRMAMEATTEIEDLKVLRSDIINGTNHYAKIEKYKQAVEELKRLKAQREKTIFFKRGKIDKEIKEQEQITHNYKRPKV